VNERRSRNLDTVLAAAAAAPLPEEQDERVLADVLTMFHTAGLAADAGVGVTDPITAFSPVESGSPSATTRDARHPRHTPRFQLAVKCTVAFGLVLGAGIALAGAGVLPSPVQSFAHDVFGGIGVPGPSPNSTPPHGTSSASATPSTALSTSPNAAPSASASRLNGAGGSTTGAPGVSSASPSTAEASLYTLCTEVVGSGNGWKTTMSSQDQARLIAAAGAENKVHQYCAQVVKSGPAATPSTDGSGSTGAASPAPSATKTKGKGDSSGNGTGSDSVLRSGSTGSGTAASETPSPDPSTSAQTR
jgi:hypothetical protein